MSEMWLNLYPDNLSSEIYDFFCQIWGVILKKSKLGRDSPCRRTPKKNFKDSN